MMIAIISTTSDVATERLTDSPSSHRPPSELATIIIPSVSGVDSANPICPSAS